ncbi:condensation domain-containing protein [Streptomyces sp. NPDC002667]|uniref:condensation domain-containing protein n=1 Tax=Streptomyces sp. NPDC002667 TaxID=3364657 RepID=UPI0036809BBD
MRSHHWHEGAVLAVVHEPPGTHDGAPLVLELCGPARTDAEAVAARVARSHRAYDVELDGAPDPPDTLSPSGTPEVPSPSGAPGTPGGPNPSPGGPSTPGASGASGMPGTSGASGVSGVPGLPNVSGVSGGVQGAGGRGRHVLRLTPLGPGGGGSPFSGDLLADLLAPLAAGTVAVGGHQRALLEAALGARGGPGRLVEQIHWDWTGPLDLGRFTASWQSVAEREAVLRASFDWTGTPRLVLHDRAAVEVVRHAHTGGGWEELLRRERERGFELYRPGLLRVSLLEGPPPDPDGTAATAPTRLLVTYHRALLDERGARLLVRQFYRSYLAGGVLPGADRRPDIRDQAHWLARQDPAGAREFWTAAAPPAGAAVSPARPAPLPLHAAGTGRIQRRLGPAQSARLRSWAASRGAGESSALHLVWALLLYRAAGTTGPLPVAFGVHLSGRDLPLRSAAGVPGLLGDALPMTVTVEASAPLADLLVRVRDAALDLTAYAWVSGDRVGEWSGRAPGSRLTETSVRFDTHPGLPDNLRLQLAAQGIGAGAPQSAQGATTVPLTLVAHHDTQDALVLDALYDRSRFTDTDASSTLAQAVQLLHGLPGRPQEPATVADALDLLGSAQVPAMAPPPPAAAGPALAVLRAGDPEADLLCLVTVPGVTPGAYNAFLGQYEGPERIVSLTATATATATAAQVRVPPDVLPELLGDGGRLTVCGAGPAGPVAHEIARGAAHLLRRPPAVVMTGLGGAAESAQALSRALLAIRTRST